MSFAVGALLGSHRTPDGAWGPLHDRVRDDSDQLARLLAHPSCPQPIVAGHVEDRRPAVRAAAIEHLADRAVLTDLYQPNQNPSRALIRALARNHHTPAAVLADIALRAVGRWGPSANLDVLTNPATPTDAVVAAVAKVSADTLFGRSAKPAVMYDTYSQISRHHPDAAGPLLEAATRATTLRWPVAHAVAGLLFEPDLDPSVRDEARYQFQLNGLGRQIGCCVTRHTHQWNDTAAELRRDDRAACRTPSRLEDPETRQRLLRHLLDLPRSDQQDLLNACTRSELHQVARQQLPGGRSTYGDHVLVTFEDRSFDMLRAMDHQDCLYQERQHLDAGSDPGGVPLNVADVPVRRTRCIHLHGVEWLIEQVTDRDQWDLILDLADSWQGSAHDLAQVTATIVDGHAA